MTSDSMTDRLLWLLGVSRTMLATRDLGRLLPLIVERFVELTGAERGYLLLKDAFTDRLTPRAARDASGGETTPPKPDVLRMAHRVLQDGKPAFAGEADSTRGPTHGPARGGADGSALRLAVCIPLGSDTERIGVLYADGHLGVTRDVTDNQRQTFDLFAEQATVAIDNARMFERASNDPLTGLPNSSCFLFKLAKELREARRDAPLGVLLLDLDSFKRINLVAGAEAGDRAMQDIANTLLDVLRTDGLVARYGSDKFAVLLSPDRSGLSIGLRLRDAAERARAAVNTKRFHGVQLSACIGGLGFPRTEDSPDNPSDAIALVDDVLARARARGAGQIEIGG